MICKKKCNNIFSVVNCGPLHSPEFGAVSCSDGDLYNSVCRVDCDEGYILTGSATRTCLDSGLWSGQSGICKRK